MKVKNLSSYPIKRPIITIDDEAVTQISFTEDKELLGYIYPNAGELQRSVSGEYLDYQINLLTNDLTVLEKDIIVYFGEEYEVIRIERYTEHLLCRLKKVR